MEGGAEIGGQKLTLEGGAEIGGQKLTLEVELRLDCGTDLNSLTLQRWSQTAESPLTIHAVSHRASSTTPYPQGEGFTRTDQCEHKQSIMQLTELHLQQILFDFTWQV